MAQLSAAEPIIDSSSEIQFKAALAAFQAGDFSSARQHCEALLREQPNHRDGLLLQSNLALQSDDLDQAIRAMQQLIAAHGPHDAWREHLSKLFNKRGARKRSANPDAARQDFVAALRHNTMTSDAWFNLALCAVDLGNENLARQTLEQFLSQCPDDAEGLRLAVRLQVFSHSPHALSMLARLRDPQSAEHALDAAAQLDQAGHPDALSAYRECLRLAGTTRASPLLLAELGQALALPAVVDSRAQLVEARHGFDAGLTALEQRWDRHFLARCEPRLEQLSWCNFKLAYQAEDDRALQSRFGDLLQRPLQQWFPQWMEAPAKTSGGAPRIGLLSSCWRDCTVGHYFGSWIGWLCAAGYRVYLYQLGPQRDAHTDQLAAKADKFRFHSGELAELVEQLRADQLDLLIYPELGMDARLLPLASLRLARKQALAWGHPVSSGLPSIDAYISCAEMEPDDADAHYRERLLRLPGLGVQYQPAQPAAHSSIDLAQAGPKVLLPHSLFKLHPDNDAVIAELAARCPDAQFLLFKERFPAWNQTIADRLERAFAAHKLTAQSRLHWLPAVNRASYLAINRDANLMLDALHWSGGNTSLDALTAGLPIVSTRGRFMRGRQSAAMLDRLGLSDWVCEPGQLVEQAARRLTDVGVCQAARQQIGQQREALFDASAAKRALLEHVATLIGQ